MRVEFCKIGRQVTLQGAEAREITGREQVALDFAKDDLDLIEPTRVLGEPVQADLEGQLQRRQPRGKLLGRVGRTVVENQMQDGDPDTERTLKERVQEGFEIDELLGRAGLGEGQPAGHDQRTEELQRAHPFIAIGHLHHFPRGGGFRGGDALARLNGGLFVSTDDEFPVRLPGRGLRVEVEPRPGFLDKLRIGRVLPRMIAPGLHLVGSQPAANRARRDARDSVLFHGDLGQLLARPPLPGLAVLPRGTARQRDHLGTLPRREGAPGPRPGRIVQHVRRLPALPPLFHRVDMATDLLGDGGILPLRVAMHEQEDLRPLHRGKGSHVTGTQLLQPRLLLRRQRDRILGPRAGHLKSPPTLAKVSKTLVCQAFSHCKLATYFVRCVLSLVFLQKNLLSPKIRIFRERKRPGLHI
jgi:hypothetical protein